MNTTDLETLLIDLELAYNDRIPEDRAHFMPNAVGQILALVPEILVQARELIRAVKLDKPEPHP